ncbi:MAG: hypothetical protein ACK52X_05105, partial [bacterium]
MVGCCMLLSGLQAQRNYAPQSVLAAGNWWKLGVTREGVYRISASWLTAAGITTTNLSSNSIRLYGNGGGMLPEDNRRSRADDLTENAIEVIDGGDGIFSGTDYLLFYARGPHHWESDATGRNWQHRYNLYADTAYFYLTIGGVGKRISTANPAGQSTVVVREMDERIFIETDEDNFLGSGKDWWGNVMGTQPGQSLQRNFTFNLPGLVLTEPVTLATRLAARSVGNAAQMRVVQAGQTLQNIPLPAVGGQFLEQSANAVEQRINFQANSSSSNLQFQLSGSGAVT